MDELILQERFEMEVLGVLNSGRVLPALIFCGGTMLRLCYELDRYSVDLDFRVLRPESPGDLFMNMGAVLRGNYELTDKAEKENTLLYELRSPRYPRRLKVEVRNIEGPVRTEPAIVFSHHGPAQLPVTTPTLQEVMQSKVEALLRRREPRDAYDIEFLIRRGIMLEVSAAAARDLLETVESITRNQINARLGPLLPPGIRDVYRQRGFALLDMKLRALISAPAG